MIIKTALATFAALSCLCLGTSLLAAGTDMSAGDRAKLSKERAKSSATFGNALAKGAASLGGDGQSEGDPCSLDIGNVNTGGRNAPREVNVFITGDVIQANRNCR